MRIERNRVVALKYTLKNDDGRVVDTNQEGAPLYYLHGNHNLVPGLEQALEGKEAGAELEVTVEAADGYGEPDASLVFEMSRSQLPDDAKVQRGTQLRVTGPDGRQRIGTIVKVKLQSVVIDANHELAGQRLHFLVRVESVRKATKDELAHGHAHAPGHTHH